MEYAELGIIRGTIQRRNLALTSAQLRHRLESDPLMKSDRDLRIFCLAMKGEIDGEMGAASMRRDWEEVSHLARDSSDSRWQYRASAELGMTATIGNRKSAAERSVSPASTPRPPLYVGMLESKAISIEKYATRTDSG